MSCPGDVIWSDGRAWMRGTTTYGDHKAWWCHPTSGDGVFRRLSEAKQADDFRWLVKDGNRVIHAEDCPPQVAYEAYTFQIAHLTDLLAQAEKDRDVYAADWHRITTERDRARAELAAALTRSGEIAADANDAYRAGGLAERAAIVAWLTAMDQPALARSVGHGEHLAGDDE